MSERNHTRLLIDRIYDDAIRERCTFAEAIERLNSIELLLSAAQDDVQSVAEYSFLTRCELAVTAHVRQKNAPEGRAPQ